MKISVVLFNLGGPDSLDAVEPFLKNLFSDPAIIEAPAPVRWLLARVISRRRGPVARDIYAQMGGGSPIVPETRAQADALIDALGKLAPEHEWHAAIAMRYWHPFADEAVREVRAFAPDRIVLLPLYPQFSGTTTGSSFADWDNAARAAGFDVPTTRVCCYPEAEGFIAALGDLTRKGIEDARRSAPGKPVRVLFSAHGLPKRTIARGDPYQNQVERTVARVREKLAAAAEIETVICYQSRVGPLEWIGPATDAEIERAAKDGCAAVVVPVAFVSEHSETLVELDIEYRKLAADAGATAYVRVPAVGTTAPFIDALAELAAAAVAAVAAEGTVTGAARGLGPRLCPAAAVRCARA